MKIRPALVVAAALTASLTPQAHAVDLNTFNQAIDQFDCGLLKTGLTAAGLVHSETTRSQLAETLRTTADLGKVDPILGLAGNLYAGRIADRALSCSIVKADPATDPLTLLSNLSSSLLPSFTQ